MRSGNIKSWLVAASVSALLPFGPVFAADMPVKAVAPAPAFIDWTGVYVGVHAGYGGGMKDWTDEGLNFPARGFLGGGQIGINKQIASFVFGLEAAGSWANISGTQTVLFGGPLFGGTEVVSANSRIDGIATLAGRAGLAADRWFVFAKGGVAGAWERHSINGTADNLFGPGTASFAVSGSEYRWAPMAGLGAEYALGGNWSVIAEYDYFHFGSRTLRMKGTQTNNGVTTPLAFDEPISQNSVHTIKVGANYRWGGIIVDPAYPPVKAASGTNWTGAYLGAQGGYGFGHKEWPGDAFDSILPDLGKYDVNGWLAGLDGGVNVQSGVFVFGVEGEWMWTGIKGGQTAVLSPLPFQDVLGLNTTIDWLAIASARAGFVAGDRLLIYGKGGVAIASERHSISETITATGLGSAVTNLSAKAVHSGFVGGVGAEYALGGNWSIKGEYDYIRMIGQEFTTTGIEAVNAPPIVGQANLVEGFNRMRQDLHIFKLGVNYHFNPMPTVVTARY